MKMVDRTWEWIRKERKRGESERVSVPLSESTSK